MRITTRFHNFISVKASQSDKIDICHSVFLPSSMTGLLIHLCVFSLLPINLVFDNLQVLTLSILYPFKLSLHFHLPYPVTSQSTLLFILTSGCFFHLLAGPFVRMDLLKWINSSTYNQIAKHRVCPLIFTFPHFIFLILVKYLSVK